MKRETSIKSKILLFIKVPPPVTGATLMNKQVLESNLLRESFIIRSVQISYADDVKEFGRYNIRKFVRFCKFFFKLNYECIFHRPRIIYFQISHLGIPFYRDLVFALLMKLFHIKVVYHLHGKGIKEKANNRFRKFLYRVAFRKADIICLSHLLVNDIGNVFYGNIHIVNNGIADIAWKNTFADSKTLNHKKISLLFLSNLIKSKGILDFLESLKILSDQNIDFDAVIVGAEGDINSKSLTAILENYKLENKVSYLGPKYGYEKEKVLCNCDILVFPTKNDAWGNVILEAMQFSKPVISTREGAIPEIIDNEITGFLIEKDSPGEIAQKLELIIRDSILRESLGQAGRKKYEEKFTLKIFEKNMDLVFKKVLMDIM
jgi:glycosyltransferase involved in cell wall biosynthesis